MGDEDDSAEVEEKEKRDFGETLRLNDSTKPIKQFFFPFFNSLSKAEKECTCLRSFFTCDVEITSSFLLLYLL